MSDGAATDRTRDEAWQESRGCPHCSGSGQTLVFDPKYDGRRVIDRQCIVYGEVKVMPFAMAVAAHCGCPMGRWMRSKVDRETLLRIPDLLDAIAGRSRWLAADPTRDEDGVPNWDFRRARRELGEKIEAK